MKKKLKSIIALTCSVLAFPLLGFAPAFAQSASSWDIIVNPTGDGCVWGSPVGVDEWAIDGYGEWPKLGISESSKGIYLLLYREHGTGWDGPTGFYPGDHDKTPIAPGESRIWSDFYLWAQNMTPTSANYVAIYARTDPYLPPPSGYRGHLVLDYVPESCGYTGPTDFWMDLTTRTELSLPIPVVTDPLQGTRFRMTVVAPVPEPSSLAALAMGIAPLGMFAVKRLRLSIV